MPPNPTLKLASQLALACENSTPRLATAPPSSALALAFPSFPPNPFLNKVSKQETNPLTPYLYLCQANPTCPPACFKPLFFSALFCSWDLQQVYPPPLPIHLFFFYSTLTFSLFPIPYPVCKLLHFVYLYLCLSFHFTSLFPSLFHSTGGILQLYHYITLEKFKNCLF